MNATETLIDHALGLRWADLPASAQTAAKTFLLDTICVGIAGANAPHAEAIRHVASKWGGGGDATILGSPDIELPAPQAAFVNAFQIHAQEFDAVHEGAVLHPLATSLAALLAEADRSGPYSGADFLGALVAGVDVAVALGLAATTPLKFFRPATAGIFGATAALARLQGLSRDIACDALGYALAFASGTMQAHVEGKPALPIQVANAARGAIAAVDLAKAGLPGPRQAIDGPFGYLPLFEAAFDLAPVLADLGRVFRIEQLSCKPFPTGRAAHGAIVAVQTLMDQHGVGAENLVVLVYSAPPLIKRLVGRPAKEGMETAYARLCFPWLAAVMFTKGGVGLADFTATNLTDKDLLALARRVEVIEDGSTEPAAFTPARATAELTDGRVVEITVSHQLGAPNWPMTPAQHRAKAAACLEFAGLSGMNDALLKTIASLDEAVDVAATLRQVWGG